MKTILMLTLVVAVLVQTAFTQQKLTENTLRMSKEAKGESVPVSDMDWITGTWAGKGLGGNVREVWTKTEAGGLIGMFALEQKGKPVFYEFLMFTVEEGQLLLKLKHFNPDLTGWEEKDEFVTFRFIKKDGNRFYFSGLTFENTSPDKLSIFLAFRMRDKSMKEEKFFLTRAN